VGETPTQTMDESIKIKITGKESLSDTGSTQQLPFNAKIKQTVTVDESTQ